MPYLGSAKKTDLEREMELGDKITLGFQTFYLRKGAGPRHRLHTE